jgi:hypothetical protein
MDTKTQIDSCIDQLRKMSGDANNELSSEQRSKLKKGVRDLKRLRHATRLTHQQVSMVVGRIAAVMFEILNSSSSE